MLKFSYDALLHSLASTINIYSNNNINILNAHAVNLSFVKWQHNVKKGRRFRLCNSHKSYVLGVINAGEDIITFYR